MSHSMERQLLRYQLLYFGTSKASKLRTRVASLYCAGTQFRGFTGTKGQILTQLPQLLAKGTSLQCSENAVKPRMLNYLTPHV
jgi:hypothetical protein